MGVNESCIAFTAPHDAAVVIVANNDEATIPKRTSLPSILPLTSAAVSPDTCDVNQGLPASSLLTVNEYIPTNNTVMAANIATPCFRLPLILPRQKHSEVGIRKIASI